MAPGGLEVFASLVFTCFHSFSASEKVSTLVKWLKMGLYIDQDVTLELVREKDLLKTLRRPELESSKRSKRFETLRLGCLWSLLQPTPRT